MCLIFGIPELASKLQEWILLISQGEWFSKLSPSEKSLRDDLARDDADPLFAEIDSMLRVIKRVKRQVTSLAMSHKVHPSLSLSCGLGERISRGGCNS